MTEPGKKQNNCTGIICWYFYFYFFHAKRYVYWTLLLVSFCCYVLTSIDFINAVEKMHKYRAKQSIKKNVYSVL